MKTILSISIAALVLAAATLNAATNKPAYLIPNITSLSATGSVLVNEHTNLRTILAPDLAASILDYRKVASPWASGMSNVQWRLVFNKTLTNVADVSACAYYPSNNTFFTCHNNANGRITEWTLDGVNRRILSWTSSQVPDAEEVQYLGGNDFGIIDEDNNRLFLFGITNNASGSTLDTNNTTIIKFATSIGVDGATASGIEGFALDRDRGGWWVAREKGPAQLLFCSYDGQTTNNYFSTSQMQQFTNATHTDFSALSLNRANQVLAVGQDEGGTQTDRVLLIDLISSNLICSIDVTNFGQLEGVYLFDDGRILVTGEVNQYAMFEPAYGGLNSGTAVAKNANTNFPDLIQYPYGTIIGGRADLQAAVTFNPTNATPVTSSIKAANSNAIGNNIILGTIHQVASGSLTWDASLATEWNVTNRIGAAVTITLNSATAGQKIIGVLIGEASGGSSRTVTLNPPSGHLVANLDVFATVLGTSFATTLTNGNGIRIEDQVFLMNGTNVHQIRSWQYKF